MSLNCFGVFAIFQESQKRYIYIAEILVVSYFIFNTKTKGNVYKIK